MSNEPSNARQYTEKEIQIILKRAGELQAARLSGENASGTSGGTTLAQLQLAATEIGIDADLIAKAAQDLTVVEPTGAVVRLLGGPWKVDADQIMPATVTEENWPLVLEEMREATGRVGFPKSVGKGFEWLSLQPDAIHVTFIPTQDKTRVRVTARVGGWSGVFYILPATMALAVSLAITLGQSHALPPALLYSLMIGLPGVTLLGGRMAFKRFCARRCQQTYQLIDRLKQAISQSSPRTLVAEPEVIAPETVEAMSVRSVVSAPLLPTTEEPLLNVQHIQKG